MTAKERAAILRVVIDMVKADAVIDQGEMNLFSRLTEKYGFASCNADAANLTLAQAVGLLRSADERHELLHDIEQMTLADGSCTKPEALLLVALEYAFSQLPAQVISVNVPNLAVAQDQVLYVESKQNAACNRGVENNFRMLCAEFKQAGLNFVYIPKVAEHYRNTPPELFHQVCSFLAPGFDGDKLDALKNYILNVSTAKFCTEQLYGKLGMSSLYDTDPGFLVNIGSSFVNGKLYYNFLKVDFSGHDAVAAQLLAFVDRYTRLLSYDVIVIPKHEDASGQFLYSGYYKQLFDIYLLRNAERSAVAVDLDNRALALPDVDRKLDGPVHTKEKAFYALVLFEMLDNGGLNLQKPSSVHDVADFDRRLKQYQLRFNWLYKCLGGSVGNEPDIAVPETRQQMKSRINRYFKQAADFLFHAADYQLMLDKKGRLVVRLEVALLLVRHNGQLLPFASSPLFEQLKGLGGAVSQ